MQSIGKRLLPKENCFQVENSYKFKSPLIPVHGTKGKSSLATSLKTLHNIPPANTI
jgi:hypothetical protein